MFQPRNIAADVADKTYYPYFDYLRAAAAIGVFASHADKYHILPDRLGGWSVQAFFALSGFLIGGILLRSKPEDLPRFYYNRATRIWIPYALTIALVAVVTVLKQGFHQSFAKHFFYMATFTYNWFGTADLADMRSLMPLDGSANHFWSICVEEQFYLIAPILILLLPRVFLFVGLAAAMLLSPSFFAAISLGALLAMTGPRIWIISLCVAAGIVFVILGNKAWDSAFISTAVVGALALMRGRQTLAGRIVGGASYPFYLNHWIGLFAVNAAVKTGIPFWGAAAAGFGVIAAFSVAHYFIVDRSIATYRHRFFTLRIGVIVGIVAFSLVGIGALGGMFIFRQG